MLSWFQQLLDGVGSVLAFLYSLIPNYGIAIILLTLGIRLVLLPLAIKQMRSMHAMQAIQPQVKALQQKYKGNRQKLNEETMKLYKERGVNPLGGCLPLLVQFPILIALFQVLRVHTDTGQVQHIPRDSRLYQAIVQQDTNFLGTNLECSAMQAGKTVPIPRPTPGGIRALECGSGVPVRVPYYLLALGMVGTTYYQQRQMQRASPNTANPQAQMLTRFMPLLFGVWGFFFPAGLVLYWTTTNAVQIAQQHFMLPKPSGAGGPPATVRESKGRPVAGKQGGAAAASGKIAPKRDAGKTTPEPNARKTGPRPDGGAPRVGGARRVAGESAPQAGGGSDGESKAGGRNGASAKKRRKR